MRKLVLALLLLGTGLCAPSRAAVVCVAPQEMKLLQSAALQQQLMVAAMHCGMTADYGAFVVAYRDRLQVADQALKAFFASRRRGEDYGAYKSRLGALAAYKSQHDPRFCESAQKVFDIALGRARERNGLAPEPPQLIDTGYEGCRPIADKLLQAALRPTPRPSPARAAIAATDVPVRAKVPVALALAVPVPQPRPGMSAARLVELARPDPTRIAKAQVQTIPLHGPTRLAVADLKPIAPPSVAKTSAPVAMGQSADTSHPKPVPVAQAAWETPRSVTAPTQAARPQRFADEHRPDDHIPNAYRPGAEWVRDAGPEAARYTPEPGPHYVQTRDGRWVLVAPLWWERE